LLGVIRPAGRRPVAGLVPLHGLGCALYVLGRICVGSLRVAYRQRSVRRHRVGVAAVLLHAQ